MEVEEEILVEKNGLVPLNGEVVVKDDDDNDDDDEEIEQDFEIVEEEALESNDDDETTEEFILDPLLMCTWCEFNLNSRSGVFKICSHPLIDVPMCVVCLENYTEEHTLIEDMSEVCAWCLHGGDLFECGNDECGQCFCGECVTRWFGEKVLDEINNDDEWLCFICKPSPALDDLSAARQSGYVASLYNDLYFESSRFNEWTLARTEERPVDAFKIKKKEISRAGELLDLILSEMNKAHFILDDELILQRKRTEIAAEIGSDDEKVEAEMKVFVDQWKLHIDILTRQHDELIEYMDLVNIDSDAIREEVDDRWNKRLRERNPDLIRLELENERTASTTGIATSSSRVDSHKDAADTQYCSDDLFTDWDGYEEKLSKRDVVYTPFPPDIVMADPFVQMYSDKPEVPHNRYPKEFEKTVPREMLRGLYYRRLYR
jgi:hypothetical protein